jgi:hypothetical protein
MTAPAGFPLYLQSIGTNGVDIKDILELSQYIGFARPYASNTRHFIRLKSLDLPNFQPIVKEFHRATNIGLMNHLTSIIDIYNYLYNNIFIPFNGVGSLTLNGNNTGKITRVHFLDKITNKLINSYFVGTANWDRNKIQPPGQTLITTLNLTMANVEIYGVLPSSGCSLDIRDLILIVRKNGININDLKDYLLAGSGFGSTSPGVSTVGIYSSSVVTGVNRSPILYNSGRVGFKINASNVFIGFALPGDFDLNGIITNSELLNADINNQLPAVNIVDDNSWINGDFNNDNKFNERDKNLVKSVYTNIKIGSPYITNRFASIIPTAPSSKPLIDSSMAPKHYSYDTSSLINLEQRNYALLRNSLPYSY